MRNHFKSEHFLCEEEECANEQFTAVFRTDIDLKAHVNSVHLKGLSKMETRQARTLDLEFSYGPRGHARGGGQDGGRGHRSRMNDSQREFDRIPEQNIVQQPPIKIDSKNEEQFPSLGGPAITGPPVQLANTVRHMSYGTAGLARTKENFPSLGGAPNEKTTIQPVNNQKSSMKQSKMPTASSLLKGSASSSSRSTTANNRPLTSATIGASMKKDSSDFPALTQSNSKKGRKNDQLLEDMILPESSVNMNLVSSKHRGLVEDYVSMASKVSKVQTVQQKDIQAVPQEIVKKNVPKLSSNDNFPSLGGETAGNANAPQWFTVKGNNKQQTKPESKEFKVNTKKVNAMPELPVKSSSKPSANLTNGVRKSVEKNNGNSKEKTKAQNNKNKENKNGNVLLENNFPSLGSDPIPPPGFSNSSQSIKKPPPGFNNSNVDLTKSIREKLKLNTSESDYSYQPPANMSKRNQALVNEFQKWLKTSESMQEFRLVSQMFRDGNYFAKSYYETCKLVLGAGFDSIFPELLALLPDIEKQQVSVFA